MATVTRMPEAGSSAPTFTLLADDGSKVRLADFKGAPVVLYFYPKDATPGCTVEAQEFRDAMPSFQKLGVEVVGISPDSVESHCKFAGKQSLNFHLLADIDHKVAEKYGVWVEKSLYGRRFWGVQRTTFLIGPDGTIRHVWHKVTPKGHPAEVLTEAKRLIQR